MGEINIPRQYDENGEDRLLWPRASELDIDPYTVGGPALVETLTSLYGPEIPESKRDEVEGGWYMVRRTPSPDSPEELLLQNMGYEPIDIYVTIGGIKRAIQRWPGMDIE